MRPGIFTGILAPQSVVRVAYSDESGTGDERDEPITVVTAVLLDMDAQWDPVAADLRLLRPKDEHGNQREDFEFKGSRLFRDLRSGHRREPADAMLRGVLAVAVRHDLRIAYGACHRRGLRRAQSAYEKKHGAFPRRLTSYEAAFFACLERVHANIRGAQPKERVLWISDKSRYETSLKNQLARFRELMGTDKTDMVPVLMQGVDTVKAHASPVVETVYFGHSNESLALQLADVCCSVVVRHMRNDTIAADYYQSIRPLVMNDGQVPLYSKADVDVHARLRRSDKGLGVAAETSDVPDNLRAYISGNASQLAAFTKRGSC